MKKVILKSFFAITIAVFITSCAAIHGGFMENSASLCTNNFSYVKMNVQGTATATYFLGIGGLAKQTLVNDAKKQLLANNPLQSNQTLANLTLNWKSSYYLGFLFIEVRCTVTADIVEFFNVDESRVVEAQNNSISTEDNQYTTQEKSKDRSEFIVGEKVRYKDAFKSFEGVISKVEGGYYFIKYTDNNGNEKIFKSSGTWLSRNE